MLRLDNVDCDPLQIGGETEEEDMLAEAIQLSMQDLTSRCVREKSRKEEAEKGVSTECSGR